MSSNQKIESNSRLGFIGLGHLGSPIARRLAARFPMVVYDRDRAKTEELRALGAAIADDGGWINCAVSSLKVPATGWRVFGTWKQDSRVRQSMGADFHAIRQKTCKGEGGIGAA